MLYDLYLLDGLNTYSTVPLTVGPLGAVSWSMGQSDAALD